MKFFTMMPKTFFWIFTLLANAFLFSQQMPFKGTNNIPGTIEAEDFDSGGQNISYKDKELGKNPNATVSDYRKVNGITDPDVEVIAGGAFSNGHKVGWMNNGDWLEYTFIAEKVENDDYLIKLRVTSTTAANGDNKGYKLLLDGVSISDNIKVNPSGGFFSEFIEIETETKITEGEHILRIEVFTTVGPAIDIDSIQFISKAVSEKTPLSVTRLVNNNAILQRNTEANIWGKGEPGNEVTIKPQWGSELKTIINTNGKWSVKVPTPDALGNGPFTISISDITKSFNFANILLGEVWFCAGQSNMDAPLNAWAQIINKEQEVANSTYDELRFFDIPVRASYQPLDELSGGGWDPCNPSTANRFSAVGYFFARDLYLALDRKVPVGFIIGARGDSKIEAWTTANSIKEIDGFENVIDELAAAEEATANETPENPFNGRYRIKDVGQFITPGAFYNAMVNPILPFTIKGANWYQGESNSNEGEQYRELLPALINTWRIGFNKPNLSFYTVQITPWGGYNNNNTPSQKLREAQFLTKSIPNTGLVASLDLGDEVDLHPFKKQEIGQRLSFLALANNYGKNIVSSGPIFKSAEFKDGKGILTFDSIGSGLKLVNGDANLFEIAGSDDVFKNAIATIVDGKLEVSATSVPNPTQVRYAWKNWVDKPTLYNKEDLPSSSFRTFVPGFSVPPIPDEKVVFTIKGIGETCATEDNGKIQIKASKEGSYSVAVGGNTTSFIKETTIGDLASNSYEVKVTDKVNNTISEFEILITEPEDLSVSSEVNTSAKQLKLQLRGGSNFTVNLNGEEFNTDQNEIVLNLSSGLNNVSVKADKDCQGKFSKKIILNDELQVYPNPIVDNLTIELGTSASQKATITILDISGRLISTKTIKSELGKISINTKNLPSGVYFVQFTTMFNNSIFKIVK